jgi:phosphohistidine phosphatase SixA
MLLYIIRHAWAEDRNDLLWADDGHRPLTAEGKARFARMVEILAAGPFAPEIVATSPLVRCGQTAELVSKGLARRPKIVELSALAPGGELAGLLAWTDREAKRKEQIAWVGHAPDVSHLAGELLGAPPWAIHFSKGAIAALAFAGLPRAGRGELRWLMTGKALGAS